MRCAKKAAPQTSQHPSSVRRARSEAILQREHLSISKSLPLGAFDELGYSPPLNAMECGFQMVGMSRRLEVHDPAGAPYRSRAL